MTKDPGQLSDIAARHPEVIKKMRAAYDQFWKEARPLMVNESAPMSSTQPFPARYKKQLEESGIPNWTPPKL